MKQGTWKLHPVRLTETEMRAAITALASALARGVTEPRAALAMATARMELAEALAAIEKSAARR